MAIKTVIVSYKTEYSMKRDIASKERAGWKVINVQTVGQGYAPGKTCCLGVLFLPLALLGKKKDAFQVTYQHEEMTMAEKINEYNQKRKK